MKINTQVAGMEQLRFAISGMNMLAEQLSGPLPGEFVSEVSTHIADRSRENAPIWKNRLRPAIHATKTRSRGSSASAKVTISDKILYAAIIHFQLWPFGTGRYHLGPISRTMPGTVEGGVGGIFITRVAAFHKQQYEAQLASVLQTILTTRRTSSFQFRP